jgi:hypothetical protein
MINEQNTIEMVNFVLDTSGKQAFGFYLLRLSLDI